MPAKSPAQEAEPERLPLSARPLRPLSESERALQEQLQQDVSALLAAGERNTGNEWGLAVATDNLATQLESLGFAVDREGFVGPDGALAQNLVVTLRGTSAAGEVVLVGARFDSAKGSLGADDNASGVAALLALARRYKDTTHARTLRLVWFSDASSRQIPETMGAWEHLHHVGRPRLNDGSSPSDEARGQASPFVACLELHGLGAYSETPGSQTYAPGMPAGHPIGEFVEVVSMAQHSALGETLAEAMGRASSIPIKSVTALEPESGKEMTAFRAYLEHACPAALVSDTQRRRFSGFGTAEDTLERLDFPRLARAVTALTEGVGSLLERPEPEQAQTAAASAGP